MTFQRADILLPNFSKDASKMNKWAVVACDQYTSEPEYWNEVTKISEGHPSTLNLTIPEIYLNDSDIEARINNVNKTMDEYISNNIFAEYKNTYIFVERTLANGVKRYGIVGMVDLEEYDFSPTSKSGIRATEATVVSRIPPRLKVRENAMLEFPHIMLLIDDESCDIVESNVNNKDNFEVLYDFDLMQSSGHITGYKMTESACSALEDKLSSLSDIEKFNKKYGVDEASPLVFAMGDGNHSLATAKTNYENFKALRGKEAAMNSPCRYALCELVNLHDKSLEFEAIHRVIFNADGNLFIDELSDKYEISYNESAIGQKFKFVFNNSVKEITILNSNEYLTVATLQKLIDAFAVKYHCEVDYIHGEDVVKKLCKDKQNFGIILEPMKKNGLYKSVILDGALPRKTFSMGEACDKRFYVEARKIK